MHRRISVFVVPVALALIGAAAALAASSPSVTTGRATHVHQTAVTLTGTVNPNGSSTSYAFEVGLTKSYSALTKAHSAGNGSKPVAASASMAGLIPGTVYHYAIVATNRYGSSFGSDRTFKTAGPPPPGAATGPAANVGATGALLTGVINTNRAVTGWRFDYGLDTTYPFHTTGGSVAANSAPVTVSDQLAGLAPGTIFHYRLVAFHGTTAISDGPDQVFMTHPSKRAKPRVSAKTTPRHDHHRPFVFTTTGRVGGPASIPAMFGCSGFVAVRYQLGTKTLSLLVVPLASDCTYTAQVTFTRRPGRGSRHRKVTLTVSARFRGNGYLTPARARSQEVVLG